MYTYCQGIITFRNMDLSSIFGLNSRFGAVLGEICASLPYARSDPLNTSVYQRVLAVGFAESGHFRTGRVGSL